jgi:hypothetical protein
MIHYLLNLCRRMNFLPFQLPNESYMDSPGGARRSMVNDQEVETASMYSACREPSWLGPCWISARQLLISATVSETMSVIRLG